MNAVFDEVLNRGSAPRSFIAEMIEWGKRAPMEIFAPNDNPADIYALVKSHLATQSTDAEGRTIYRWDDLEHRRAAMIEVMRVHAGFESSWNWKEGVDRANQSSQKHIEREETGAWQVSFDSLRSGDGAMIPFARAHDIETPAKFISAMKASHYLAMEYYARLVRVNVAWAGPLIGRRILPELRRDAMAEFQEALA